MLIQSEFRDYYDVMQKHGVDKTILYDRKTVMFSSYSRYGMEHLDECIALAPLGKALGEMRDWSDRVGPWFTWSFVVVGFCGKLYPGVHYHYYDNRRTFEGYAYGIEAVDKAVARVKDKHVTAAYRAKAKKRGRWHRVSFNRQELESQFIEIRSWCSDAPHMLLNAPVFFIGYAPRNPGKHRFVNPCLKDVEFHKVVGPAEAYQELQMYLSGVLTQQPKPTVVIRDEDLAAKKGFDKWSFRKKVR